MVITPDSDSGNPGSIPGTTLHFYFFLSLLTKIFIYQKLCKTTVFRLRSVMVITPDSDSGNPGSIPGATWKASFGRIFCVFFLQNVYHPFPMTSTIVK
jgi:hypothetical protein